MATLNSSNITNGNTVQSNDLLQLYDALTPGGGTTGAYNVTVSGSLIGNASTATSSSFATTSSYSTKSATSTSSSLATTSSFAVTASYALNGGSSNTIGVSVQGESSIKQIYPIAGFFNMDGGNYTLDLLTEFPWLPINTQTLSLGNGIWITTQLITGLPETTGLDLTYDNVSKRITFTDDEGGYAGDVMYTGYLKL
jgi:hypothetical protein